MSSLLYLFRAFSAFGFATQWGLMLLNGSFVTMLRTFWAGEFASGTPVRTRWTGFLPVDWFLGLLVVFFGAVNNVNEVPDRGPVLMLLDLIFTLAVFNLVSVVEDRRSRKTGALRGPGFWQFVWNWGGAASVLPIYAHLYLTTRSRASPPIPRDQARALPLSALYILVISLPAILPSFLDCSTRQIQNAIAVWFLAPLSLSLFQDSCACLISAYLPSLTNLLHNLALYNPLHILPFNLVSQTSLLVKLVPFRNTFFRNSVTVAYAIIGLTSAIVHIAVAYWAFALPDVSWARVYLPNYAAVRSGTATHLMEGSMLFMQWDHVMVYLVVAAMAAVMLRREGAGVGEKVAGVGGREKIADVGEREKATSVRVRDAMGMGVGMVVAGPGAALAWLMCRREGEIEDAAREKAR